jgi:hypothetical protein
VNLLNVGQPSDKANDGEKKEEGEMIDEPKPRPLHRTNSIFLRTLLPNIARQEIEGVRYTRLNLHLI